jgi:PadR family transcriptional regulator PadR
MTERRMTQQTDRILATLAIDPGAEWWGSRIAPAAGLKSGTIYPALMRMERFGWLTSRWEDIDPSRAGRPRRRLYRLTGEGEQVARERVAMRDAAKKSRRAPALGWRGAPGGQAV